MEEEQSCASLPDGTNSSRTKTKILTNKTNACKSQQGRRKILKKKIYDRRIYRAPRSISVPVSSNRLDYRGSFFTVGDIVSVVDKSHKVYYAQIRGLLKDQYCEKSAVFTWLLPTQNSPKDRFDPDTYIMGPEDDVPRTLDCLEFVCHAPNEYYKISCKTEVPEKPVCGYLKTKKGHKIVSLPYNGNSDSD